MSGLLNIWRRRFAAWVAAIFLTRSKADLRRHEKWMAIAREPVSDMRAAKGFLIGAVLSVPCWAVLWLLWRLL